MGEEATFLSLLGARRGFQPLASQAWAKRKVGWGHGNRHSRCPRAWSLVNQLWGGSGRKDGQSRNVLLEEMWGDSWREQGGRWPVSYRPRTPVHTVLPLAQLTPMEESPLFRCPLRAHFSGRGPGGRREGTPSVTPRPPEGAAGSWGHLCSAGRHGGSKG